MAVIEADDTTFRQVVESQDLPVLVDFWGPSCGPCVGVNKVIEAIAGEVGQAVLFVKVNVEDAIETAIFYEARSLPCLVFLENGVVVHRIVGAPSKDKIRTALANHFHV